MKKGTETAVSYCRVSTIEQGQKRFSLENQKQVIEQFCIQRGITLVQHFQDMATGTKFDRDGFNAMRTYCKRHKPNFVLVWRWDRLGRNAIDMLSTVREFQKMGIEINAIEQWKEGNNADSMFMLGLQAILAERESAVTGERVKMNTLKLNEQGIWVNKLPLGYRRSMILDEKGKRPVEICPTGQMVVKAVYKHFIEGKDKMEIRRQILTDYGSELKQIKYNFVAMAVRRILTNEFYLGKVTFKNTEGESKTVKGIHEAIIDEGTFKAAQNRLEVLEGRHGKSSHSEKEHYHLKGGLICLDCGVPLRAYVVKKKLKNGKIQNTHYYDCKNGHIRIQCKDAHDIMYEAIEELTLDKSIAQKGADFIHQKIESFLSSQIAESEKVEQLMKDLSERAKKLDDLLLSGLDVVDYNRMRKDVQQKIDDNKARLQTLKEFVDTQTSIVSMSVKMLTSLSDNYDKADGFLKRKIVQAIFPYGFFIDKSGRKVLTCFVNTFIALNTSKSGDYKRIKVLSDEGLTFCSPKVTKVEPKINLTYEIALIKLCF